MILPKKTVATASLQKAWSTTYPNILKATSKCRPFRILQWLSCRTVRILENQHQSRIISQQLSENGGGTSQSQSGKLYHVTGSIFLASNIRLHLEEWGQNFGFHQSPRITLPVVKSRWEGTFLMNYSPSYLCD